MILKIKQEVFIYWATYKNRLGITLIFLICSLVAVTSYFSSEKRYVEGLVTGKDYLAGSFGNVDQLIISLDGVIVRFSVDDNNAFTEGSTVCLLESKRALNFSRKYEIADKKNCSNKH